MTAPDTLRLAIGSSRGLRLAHDGLALLAAAGLLSAGVHPHALHGSLAALAVAWAVSRWRLARAQLRGSLQLRSDGTATLCDAAGNRGLSLLDLIQSPEQKVVLDRMGVSCV